MHPDDERPPLVTREPAVAALGQRSFLEHSLQNVLDEVTALAGRLLSGSPAASVTVLAGSRPATVAATDQIALRLDEAQYRLGTGPCLEAAGSGRPVEVEDVRADGRFGAFGGRAAAAGVRGILSFPFPFPFPAPRPAPAPVSGGMNLYVRTADPWDPATRRLAADLAAAAVGPLANRYLYQRALERAEHLEAALASRAVIDQAKGILMERHKLSADQAFQALARASMDSNTKVRDIAQQVVQTGVLPPG